MPTISLANECPDRMFRVEAAEADFSATLCRTASELRTSLARCGLVQRSPLTIEVVESLSHPIGSCLAYFDCEYDLIRLTAPSAYSRILDPEEPYAHLPAGVLARALLTHELAHAFVTQAAQGQQIDIVDQEYIAAAMELEFMSPSYRQVLLEGAPVSLPPSEGLIDIWIYGLSPRKFAVNAWYHFSEIGNGCQLVRQIIAGKVSFSKEMRPDLR